MTRREAVMTAVGAAALATAAASLVAGAPAILKARAATNSVPFGIVGGTFFGSRVVEFGLTYKY